MRALRRFTVRAHLPQRLMALEQLAMNLRWSWERSTQELFAAIDPELWEGCGRDPIALLGAVSPARLDELAVEEAFTARLDVLSADVLARSVVPRFYQRDDRGVPPRWIEMVHHTLQTLGPKVLAARMVRDYVERCYVPAALSLRRTCESVDGVPYGAARGLADYCRRARQAWPQIQITGVDSTGLSDDRYSVRS